MPGDLFAPTVVTDEMAAATGGRAWLAAMLDAEVALTAALADVGLATAADAAAVAAACDPDRFDLDALARDARQGGNPVIPLVAALRLAVGPARAGAVHRGATSQDIIDTAMMLVVARSAPLLTRDLTALAGGCAALADEHRATVMAGRTLLQQALPITFGLKAAGWLAGTMAARQQLDAATAGVAAQLGGAAGTLAAYGGLGPEVAARFAARVGLPEPIIPWHTARQRVVAIGAALATAAGTAAKISGDIALLMQSEVGEAAEPAGEGRGGSSSMPHKRNPVGAAAVSSAARRAHALLPVLFGALAAQHERDLGGWQAEWPTLSELLALAGGAVARTAETVAGLEVDAPAMAANVTRSGGRLLSERVAAALQPALGAIGAAAAVGRAARSAEPFAAALGADPAVASVLDAAALDELLDPAGYLGSAGTWIDRALDAYRSGGPAVAR